MTQVTAVGVTPATNPATGLLCAPLWRQLACDQVCSHGRRVQVTRLRWVASRAITNILCGMGLEFLGRKKRGSLCPLVSPL